MMRGIPASLLRTAGFAGLFLVMEFVSRAAMAQHSDVPVVWPAAGVAVMWFVAQRAARMRWADPVALVAVIVAVNLAAGAGAAVAVVCAAAGLAQVEVFRRLLPRAYRGSDGAALRPRDLWMLLAVVAGAAAAGAAVGVAGLWLVTGALPGSTAAIWSFCDAGNMLLFAAGMLHLQAVAATYRARYGLVAAGCRRSVRAVSGARAAEYAAVTLCALAGYGVAMIWPGVSMVFPLIALTVWAAVRLSTTYVMAHSLGAAVVTAVCTLHGYGPFTQLGSPSHAVLVGQVFIATITLVGLALALGRDERDTLTAELAGEKERASQQADLLNAVVDSMADGLAVVDERQGIVRHNPAARRLMGRIRPADETGNSSYYGLSRLDGTPFADEELPYRQAIADGQVHIVDLLTNNPDLPQERILRFIATPLTLACGARQAVVLAHDITAERRHRDELASFAGVVAHDLLNPLATVEGWTEAVADALTDAPEHPAVAEANSGLARVERAAARMRGLVNDLLAYTTTRDATIKPATVDLHPLVTDVADARIDTAMAADTPVPTFTVGDLDPVHADPVLLRQLLDNLISNAVKYTAAGVTPHITITGTRQDDTVAVTIADNGIGIPAGQHDAVFDTFHRAHRGKGYGGTGLGLAICKRTVERHGGTITATDNPGGGTRFTFTLPAAADTAVTDPTTNHTTQTPELVA
ncbi:sensor histidine kinase [Krasilnikovia sp. MM14-A1259]|uniref:sensor histidine kinase n=1 Tax=Krasilnikovia sp. MM14-A1259 TaxID=3373539 RepID=UPI003817BB6D